MVNTTQYLIDIGFKYEYISLEKKWNHTKLFFSISLEKMRLQRLGYIT